MLFQLDLKYLLWAYIGPTFFFAKIIVSSYMKSGSINYMSAFIEKKVFKLILRHRHFSKKFPNTKVWTKHFLGPILSFKFL